MIRDVMALRLGWQYAWLAAALLAALLWLLHHGLRPAEQSELRLVTGTVQSVSYQSSARSSRKSTQVLALSTANGREIFRLPRYTGAYRPGVDVSVGDRVELRVSSYDGVYSVRIGRRDVIDYATARATFVHRQVLPGVLATAMTLAAAILAFGTWFWPQMVAAIDGPGVGRGSKIPGPAERGRLADLQSGVAGIPGRDRLRRPTPHLPR